MPLRSRARVHAAAQPVPRAGAVVALEGGAAAPRRAAARPRGPRHTAPAGAGGAEAPSAPRAAGAGAYRALQQSIGSVINQCI